MRRENNSLSKVLLIDDDPAIRELSSDYLKSNGIEVLQAADGQEGLAIFQERCSEISVIVLDMVMPKLSGRECWLRLRQIDPDVQVIVTTGYCMNSELEACIKEGAIGYLLKPFQLGQLLAGIRKAIPKKMQKEEILRDPAEFASRAERFPIRTMVHFRESGEAEWQEGQSVNISRTGILFRSAHAPQTHATLEMRIVFPKEVTGHTPMNVICWGPVVRIESSIPADSRWASAVAIKRHRLSQV